MIYAKKMTYFSRWRGERTLYKVNLKEYISINFQKTFVIIFVIFYLRISICKFRFVFHI